MKIVSGGDVMWTRNFQLAYREERPIDNKHAILPMHPNPHSWFCFRIKCILYKNPDVTQLLFLV